MPEKNLGNKIKFSKKTTVIGGIWQTYENYPNQEELRNHLQDFNAEWVVTHVLNSLYQVAYINLPNTSYLELIGLKDIYSLAGLISSMNETPWVGKFKLNENESWLIAVGDSGLVLPYGDFYGSNEDVNNKYQDFIGEGGWIVEEDSDFTKIENYLIDVKQDVLARNKIKNKSKRALKIKLVFIMLLLIIVSIPLTAYHTYSDYEKYKEEKLLSKLIQEKENLNTFDIIHGYEKPKKFVTNCLKTLSNIELIKNNWYVKKAACESKETVITWEINNGNAMYKNKPDCILLNNYKTCIKIYTNEQIYKGKEELNIDYNSMNSYYTKLLDIYLKHHIKLSSFPSPYKVIDNSGFEQETLFSKNYIPFNLISDINKIPAIRVKSIIFNGDLGTWNFVIAVLSSQQDIDKQIDKERSLINQE